MGGSVEEAKRYVRNMKDQSRHRADKESQKQRFKVYHQGNKQTVNKKRMDRFEKNKETLKKRSLYMKCVDSYMFKVVFPKFLGKNFDYYYL